MDGRSASKPKDFNVPCSPINLAIQNWTPFFLVMLDSSCHLCSFLNFCRVS